MAGTSSALIPTSSRDFPVSSDFTYSSWDANTDLWLTNVPWNSDYRDIVQMDSLDALNAWLDSKPGWGYTNSSVQKFNDGIVKIDLPINEAMKYNYIRARNGVSPVSNTQRDYFYFITGVRYGAPNTTYVSLQLDVISTFLYEVTFGHCYVERGHIGIANSNQFNAYGREYLTVPEGIDLGGEYRTVHVEFEKVMQNDVVSGYDILVCSTLDLTQAPGTVTNPSLQAARGSTFQGIPAGAEFYIFPTGEDLKAFFAANTATPWISQSIISITLIPNMSRYVPGYSYGTDLSTDSSYSFYAAGSDAPQKHVKAMLADWRNNQFLDDILGSNYSFLKKFLTFPYLMLELTTFTGSPIVIKPEAWQDPDATIVEMAGLMPPAQRIMMMPVKYNWDAETDSATQPQNNDAFDFDDFGEFLDFAVSLDNFPQLPVVNNSAIAFLANNKNGIAFQFTNASWDQQKALMGAQAGVDVQNAQIGNMARQSAIGNRVQQQNAALASQNLVNNAGIGALGGMSGALGDADPVLGIAGSAVGAAGGMIQAGNNAAMMVQSATNSILGRSDSAISDIQTAGSVRDTNNAYATAAARGDYHNAIAGIQAKLQDAKMMQPSVSGQFNGDSFNLINGKFGYSLRWKMVNLNALRTLGNYWLRYGYAINQFMQMPASLHCMTKFTYWKLTQTYISQGAFPEGFKQVIRGIFEKGVTVWKNPDDIGNTSLFDNQPLTGISY